MHSSLIDSKLPVHIKTTLSFSWAWALAGRILQGRCKDFERSTRPAFFSFVPTRQALDSFGPLFFRDRLSFIASILANRRVASATPRGNGSFFLTRCDTKWKMASKHVANTSHKITRRALAATKRHTSRTSLAQRMNRGFGLHSLLLLVWYYKCQFGIDFVRKSVYIIHHRCLDDDVLVLIASSERDWE